MKLQSFFETIQSYSGIMLNEYPTDPKWMESPEYRKITRTDVFDRLDAKTSPHDWPSSDEFEKIGERFKVDSHKVKMFFYLWKKYDDSEEEEEEGEEELNLGREDMPRPGYKKGK